MGRLWSHNNNNNNKSQKKLVGHGVANSSNHSLQNLCNGFKGKLTHMGFVTLDVVQMLVKSVAPAFLIVSGAWLHLIVDVKTSLVDATLRSCAEGSKVVSLLLQQSHNTGPEVQLLLVSGCLTTDPEN